MQNLAPGATERLGFVTQELRKKYPRLIICDLSGYGSSGPYRDKKAYDMLIQAETGLISITGTEETPCKVGISVADIACGMYAYSGILTALLVRSKTGEGVALETSLFDSLGGMDELRRVLLVRRIGSARARAQTTPPSRPTGRCRAGTTKWFISVCRMNANGKSFAKWFWKTRSYSPILVSIPMPSEFRIARSSIKRCEKFSRS